MNKSFASWAIPFALLAFAGGAAGSASAAEVLVSRTTGVTGYDGGWWWLDNDTSYTAVLTLDIPASIELMFHGYGAQIDYCPNLDTGEDPYCGGNEFEYFDAYASADNATTLTVSGVTSPAEVDYYDSGYLYYSNYFNGEGVYFTLSNLVAPANYVLSVYKTVADSAPEPSSWTLSIVGIASVGGLLRRRRRLGRDRSPAS
jgi:hypothetical protein